MRKLIELRAAMFEAEVTGRDIAKAIGLNPTYFSMALRGRYVLDSAQKRRIAEIVKQPESKIFPEV